MNHTSFEPVIGGVVGDQQPAVWGQRYFVDPMDAPGADDLFGGRRGGRIEIDHPEHADAVNGPIAGIEPPTMRRDAIGTRNIVVHCSVCVEFGADEAADPPLERVVIGVDYVDALVRAISQIVFSAIPIDPADIKRPKRVARDWKTSNKSGPGSGWGMAGVGHEDLFPPRRQNARYPLS